MRKKLISAMLCMTMAVSVMLTGCGGDNQSAATDTKSEETQAAATAETKETVENEEVTLTLGIWPEDTLTDDIQVHEVQDFRMYIQADTDTTGTSAVG